MTKQEIQTLVDSINAGYKSRGSKSVLKYAEEIKENEISMELIQISPFKLNIIKKRGTACIQDEEQIFRTFRLDIIKELAAYGVLNIVNTYNDNN